jgi:hypothetical protein
MAIPSRIIKDQRSVSRVAANLECQFTFGEGTYEAQIRNLSLNGAFLWSPFIPPQNSHIVITLKTPLLKNTLTVESEVVRTERASKNGVSAFAVRFSHNSLDLIELIKDLVSQPLRNRVQKPTSLETKPGEK